MAHKDFRAFLDSLEKKGEIVRIKAQVSQVDSPDSICPIIKIQPGSLITRGSREIRNRIRQSVSGEPIAVQLAIAYSKRISEFREGLINTH